MNTPALPVEVLLVEDDAADELMTREVFEENKIGNRLHVVRDRHVTKPVEMNEFIVALRQIDGFFLTVVRLPSQSAHPR